MSPARTSLRSSRLNSTPRTLADGLTRCRDERHRHHASESRPVASCSCPPVDLRGMSVGAAIVLGAVLGCALGVVLSVTTDVPLAPEAGLVLGALAGWLWGRRGAEGEAAPRAWAGAAAVRAPGAL